MVSIVRLLLTRNGKESYHERESLEEVSVPMSTVLFLNGPASGHVYPTLGLVEQLVACGERVVYVSSEAYRPALERIGAAYVACEDFLAKEDPFETQHYLALVNKILASYEIYLPLVRELSRLHSFDYVIHDAMYGCGPMAARMLGVPNVATCTSFVGAERLPTRHTGYAAAMKANMALLQSFTRLSARIRQDYDLPRKLEIQDVFFNKGLLNLVYTSEAFHPAVSDLDETFAFVGPNLTDRRESVQLPENVRLSSRTIYISLGTVFNDVLAFYQQCFAGLASFDGHVVLSVGKRVSPESLGEIPGNFTVMPFVPQLEMLAHAELFITHGGMNSVNEALYHGVPLIVVPMAADQPIVASRVAALGAGLKLEREQATAEHLRQAVDEVLGNPSYRANSSRIGQSLRAAGGQQAAIREVLRFKAAHGID
jgi:MGT family glycosyltransferase